MTIAANYLGFVKQELEMREMLGYPPFQRLLRIIVRAEDKNSAATTLRPRGYTLVQALDRSLLGYESM
jgi:primosomal protein N'